ncbi:MAG: PHB depolymerase family esterase [Sphingomonadales bacterium]|nr:MAG: PHB depolymerase family esterase [Sphingomonadales bacterium]
MRRLSDTITRLSTLRGRPMAMTPGAESARLNTLRDFGSNPGALGALYHVPEGLPDGAALVVVLHGCTQNAAGYDRGSGWSHLADEQGFAVLLPEQQRANNMNLCFNWYNDHDTQRGGGEALSIRQMVAAMIAEHRLDPARVYVTGLSAGGAMTSVMLATYPDVFAGGAIIAGLPYGTATSIPEAFDRMRAHGGPAAAALGGLVSAASGYEGPWPTISVWHGGGDSTVYPANADLVIEQWRTLHRAAVKPALEDKVDGHAHRVWRNAEGRNVIEEYRLAGLGHGTPLSTSGDEACGVAGPYMLEAGISSTRRIASFWGLVSEPATRPVRAAQAASQPKVIGRPDTNARAERQPEPAGVGRVIEDALRAAGLMR